LGVLLAACQTTPGAVVVDSSNCPVIKEPIACPACEVQRCPEPEVIERVVLQSAPPAPASDRTRTATAGDLDLPVIGTLEYVVIEPPGLRLEAMIDTAADLTTVRAGNIRTVEKDGKRYVLYTLADPETGEEHELETRLRRRAAAQHGEGRHYVVLMWLALGDYRARVEVGLSDRVDMAYPLRVGRNLLTDVAIVDVSRKHTLDH
jgi:hypothetical protein